MQPVHTRVHTEVFEGPSDDIDRKVRQKIDALDLDPLVKALIHEAHGEVIARNREAEAKLEGPEPVLVDYAGAARLLGTTVAALKTRMSRGDTKLMAAKVQNGRAVRFNVVKLTEKNTPGRRS
jgi:hypothetical protein